MMSPELNPGNRTCRSSGPELDLFTAKLHIKRRRQGPPDDATVPLDRLRSTGRGGHSGARPEYPPQPDRSHGQSPRSNIELAPSRGAELSRGPFAGTGPSPTQPLAPNPQSAQVNSRTPSQSRGGPRIPRWAWAAMAGGLVLLLVVILVPMFSTSLGFTLVVKGAPGSDVFVDGTQVGVPANDGTIRAFGLDASHE